MKKQILQGFISVEVLLLLTCIVAVYPKGINFFEHFRHYAQVITPSKVYAANYELNSHPYGGSKSGTYGEKKKVSTINDAQKVLNTYFKKRDIKTGNIKEKEFYFEAEILDKKGDLIDKVIIDKRTGRIRSIY
jgi:hypothetical protein